MIKPLLCATISRVVENENVTRYNRLLAMRRALVSAPGDVGPKLWRLDALIQRERASPRYTGAGHVAPLSRFMLWYTGA